MTRRRLGLVLSVLVVVVGVAGVVWWAGQPMVRVPLPPRGAAPVAMVEPETSVVSLPVVLGLAELAELVAERVPPVVVDDRAVPTGNATLVDVLVRRTGDVVAREGEEGAVHLEVPLSFELRAYSARKASKRAAQGKETPQGVQARGALVLEVEQRLEITESWALVSHTTLSHRWVDVPKVQLGPIQVGVRKLLDRKLEQRWHEVAAELDARLAEQDQLGTQLQQTWVELATPRPLGDPPVGWLVVEPDSLFVSDPVVRDGAWRMTLGLIGRVGVVSERPAPGDPGPLPPRTEPPAGTDGVRISMRVALGWEGLTAVAKEQLVGPEWSAEVGGLDATTVRVHDLLLYPSGTAIAAVLDYTVTHPGGVTEGTLALSATPRLDVSARRVDLIDFDYALRTPDALVARPNALIEESVEAVVQQRLSFPLGARLDQARLRLDEVLSGGRTDSGRTLSGRVDTLTVRRVWLTDDALVVEALAEGELVVTLGALAR